MRELADPDAQTVQVSIWQENWAPEGVTVRFRPLGVPL